MSRALAYSWRLMTSPTFSPDEFREAQHQLGLSDMQLAAMLGVDVVQVRRMKVRDTSLPSWRPVRSTTARLLQAYLEGYRPADWPV